MTMMNTNGAAKSARLPRPTLSGQIDRLDSMLDGLAEALNESVADAVRDVVGQTVREAVEAAVKDVLDDPELVRAAVARHAPAAAVTPDAGPVTPRRSLAAALGRTIGWLCALAAGKASDAGTALGHGWTWAMMKVREACGAAWEASSVAASALQVAGGLAWKYRGTCAAALGVGALVGLAAYCAGPMVSSALCGLAGAAVSLGGSLLAGLFRPFGGD